MTQRVRTFQNKARRVLKHNGPRAHQDFIAHARAHNRRLELKLRDISAAEVKP